MSARFRVVRLHGLALALWVGTCLSAQAPQQPNPATPESKPPQPLADVTFDALVDRYFEGLFHFLPARATYAGFHQFDAELPAYTRMEIEAEAARTRRALEELTAIPSDSLSKDRRFDARLLEGSMRGRLLDLEQIRMWEKDPNFYNSLIGESLYVLVQRNFAPLEERVKSLVAREQRVPALLASARQNVVNPPAVYTTLAIRQVGFEIQFLQHDLPLAVGGLTDAPLQEQFARVNQQALDAYEKYQEYLKTDLAPRSHGSFALGAENFRRKLLYDEMVNTPLTRLLRIGEHALRRTQSDFKATAALIDPSKTPGEVLKAVSQDHPDADHLIPETQAALGNLRKFLVSHPIATVLSPEDPRVTETPPFMRALTFTSMDTPGPFEEISTEAFYNVTLPDPAWSAEEKEQHLRFFNRSAIQDTSIHEVFPGHYTQFLWVQRAPTKVRKLVGCSSNAEGWAHYAEQMMLEQGYGEGDPKLLLVQLQAALVRLCRYLVAIRLHTRGMSLEEAVTFFEREGYMEPVNARREALRGTEDPMVLVYTLGKLEVLKLRDDVQKKVGEGFNLKEFHNRFLSYGYPPIKLIREEMLGDDSPPL